MLLSEANKSITESYYEVSTKNLQRILTSERMNRIHSQLNENYIDRLIMVSPVIAVDQLRYFYQRGIVIDSPKNL
jgi:hypothetical protein